MSVSTTPRAGIVLDEQNYHPDFHGGSKYPCLAVYFDVTASMVVNSSNIVITVGSSTYTFPYVGRTTEEIASDISSSSGFIHANALCSSPALGSGILSFEEGDLTSDGGSVIRVAGHMAKYLEETRIRVLPPYSESRSLPWYPLIDRGSVVIVKDGVTYTFTVPEFYSQEWSTMFGANYVDQRGIRATVLGDKMIRVPRTPLLWIRNNIGITINNIPVGASVVEDVDVHNGIIKLRVAVEKTDKIIVSYTYQENRLVYKAINLNPSMEHNPSIVDQTVLIYLLPSSSSLGMERRSTVNHLVSKTLSGAIASLPKSAEPVLVAGAFQVRPSGVIEDITVTDTRTRGGGIKKEKYDEALRRNREAFSVADAGRFDGVPFPGAATGVLRLKKSLIDTYGLDYIDETVRRHLAVGGNLILDFVD